MAVVSQIVTAKIGDYLDAIRLFFKHPVKLTLVIRDPNAAMLVRDLVIGDDDLAEVLKVLQARVDKMKENETKLASATGEPH